MPNLTPPITTIDQAIAYRDRILAAVPPGHAFTPLMTLYLTDQLNPDTIIASQEYNFIKGVKLYPAGATTNSQYGISDLKNVYPILSAMEKIGLPLLVHGEVTDPEVDIFDREAVFIDQVLIPLKRDFPGLKIVLEHITTKQAVDYIANSDSTAPLAATITAHHLLYNRNALFQGGIRPHYYCLPVLKREQHRQALLQAATSGNPRFFLGTDSAPHSQNKKESSCGCAGCFTAPHAMELYATAFDSVNAIERLEGFSSWYGADFYELPRNKEKIRLIKSPSKIPQSYSYNQGVIIPLDADKTLEWSVVIDNTDQTKI